MRKLVVSELISLDGVIENPEWSAPYHSFDHADSMAFKYDELRAADALLLGRVTYEEMSRAWPDYADFAGEFAERMNSYPKHVASTTLEATAWNGSTIKGDLAEQITKLKEQEGRNILVVGSGNLAEALLRLGLVDELVLMVFPVVVGEGRRLFTDTIAATLALVDARTFASGVIALTYRTAPAPTPGD